jgi:hypothetical protein
VKERHSVFSSTLWSAFLSKKIVIHPIESLKVELEIPYKFATTYPRSPIQAGTRCYPQVKRGRFAMWNGKFALSVVFGLLITIGLGNSVVHAQSTFGSVRGATQDPTGAIIPEAQVTLHSVDENTDAMATSDDQGNFSFEKSNRDTTV